MKSAQRLLGKKAVVIGGGRGICKGIARAFLEEGASVVIVSQVKEELKATKKELSVLGDVDMHVADVSSAKDMKNLALKIQKKWKGVDILVNGASISGPIGSVLESDPKEWSDSVRVTLMGTFHGIRFLAPMMVKKKQGVIINFVGAGEGPFLNYSSYTAAKGGVMRLNETVAAELKDTGVRMNAIAPGAVNTRFLEDLLNAGPKKAGKENYERALKQRISGGVSPEKAAKLCAWLASDESIGITGKIFSAQWDPYEDFPKHINDLMSTDIYTMRRVRPKDRGFDWDPFDPIRK